MQWRECSDYRSRHLPAGIGGNRDRVCPSFGVIVTAINGGPCRSILERTEHEGVCGHESNANAFVVGGVYFTVLFPDYKTHASAVGECTRQIFSDKPRNGFECCANFAGERRYSRIYIK